MADRAPELERDEDRKQSGNRKGAHTSEQTGAGSRQEWEAAGWGEGESLESLTHS